MTIKINFKYDVFISYATEDKDTAIRLADALTNSGINVWFDRQILEVGDKWKKEIREKLNESKYFFSLLSKTSMTKQSFVRDEIIEAIKIQNQNWSRKFFIPIRIEPCEILFSDLKDIHTINLFENWDSGFQRLIRLLLTKEKVLTSDTKIIGFDLGHGETSISKAYALGDDPPEALEILNGKKSIITAVGINNDKGIIIGEDAYVYKGNGQANILFKSYEIEKQEVKEPIKLFVSKCMSQLTENKLIDIEDENTIFYVGCPSGWTLAQRQNYQNLLVETGLKNVIIVPESRAAFVYVKEMDKSLNNLKAFEEAVLIIDIGSSTIDLTLVRNLNEIPLDFGHNKLGLGAIDLLIFEKTLNNYSSQEKEQILSLFSENPILKEQCLLDCRYAKENFFSRTNQDYWKNNPCEVSRRLSGKLFWIIEIFQDDMEEILLSPIEVLKGKSWVEEFSQLIHCYKLTENYINPELIILTGGGAKIPLIKQIISDSFPSSSIHSSSNPDLAISLGLAHVGKIDFRVKSFKEEVEVFVESQRLYDLFEKSLSKLVDTLTEDITSSVIQISVDNLNKWRNGILKTFEDIEARMNNDVKEKMNSQYLENQIKLQIDNWMIEINSQVEEMANSLCEKYKIEKGKITLMAADNNFDALNIYLDHGKILESKYNQFESMAPDVVIGAIIAAIVGVGLVVLGPIAAVVSIAAGVLNLFGDSISTSTSKKLGKLRDNIPVWMRKTAISESKIKELVQSNKGEIENKIRESISNGLLNPEKLKQTLAPLKITLYKSAERASILIS
ncbi:MAG: TIR domain-containing protein [Saprospiraceae bacterium]|nr:TIR domain-containing protein [Saprospiraceae bacterium]